VREIGIVTITVFDTNGFYTLTSLSGGSISDAENVSSCYPKEVTNTFFRHSISVVMETSTVIMGVTTDYTSTVVCVTNRKCGVEAIIVFKASCVGGQVRVVTATRGYITSPLEPKAITIIIGGTKWLTCMRHTRGEARRSIS
jgi:hypothetical protein